MPHSTERRDPLVRTFLLNNKCNTYIYKDKHNILHSKYDTKQAFLLRQPMLTLRIRN